MRRPSFRIATIAACIAGSGLASGAPARAADDPNDAAALARAVQNPVANMSSLPFQNNTNLDAGPRKHTQNILNIQPVVPFALSSDWNVITRTVLPVMSQPGMMPGQGTTFGLGATEFTAFFSPARPTNGIIWGAGPVIQLPTTTDKALGSNIWGAGPAAVALTMRGPWVIGALVNNVWSFGGNRYNSYNQFTTQPFINYNFPHSPGTYLSSSPIITSNWMARSGQQWTVPVGLALGQVFRVHGQAVNAQLGAYYNVVRPDDAASWQIRAQISFLFPR